MAEVINTNVFDANKKFVDFSGLDYFWTKAKTYIDGVDAAMSAKVVILENTVGDSTKGLVKDVKLIQDELNSLSEGDDSIATQINNAIAALDLPNTYDANGTAAGLNDAMDKRVKVLEAIDHTQLAADASAAAVATILDGAPEKFDTLKEVAQWIADSESATTAADLVTRVSALESIDHEAYVAADTALETSVKSYVDGRFTNEVTGKFDVIGAAADAQAAAIAQAKADAAETLKAYYTKTEVDNLLTTNSVEDRAYAKQYTDELFGSFQFATNSDIDTLFA